PVFNGERYLAQAIESILAQNYPSLEIIVVDDGSTDATAAIALSYGKHVHYLKQPNAGPAAARNLGLRAATGAFISLLEADDLCRPAKLIRQAGRIQARCDLDYCLGYVQNFWIPELSEEEAKFRDHRISKPLAGYVTGTLLARREFFNA